MNKILFLIAVLVYPGFALAGSATGKITSIFVANNSASVLFMLDSLINDTPNCNEAKRFSIDLRKPGGMAAYMAILEAKKYGFEVRTEGLNTCINEWNSEDIKFITLK